MENKEEKKIEKVVVGPVKTKKRSELRKILDTFVEEDSTSVKDFMVHEVAVPLIKKGLTDTLDMMLYGREGRSSGRGGNTPYSSRYNQVNGRTQETRQVARVRTRHDYEEIVVGTRGEAEKLLDELESIINQYGTASIADLYSACGMTAPYTDNKYGWMDIRGAEPVRLRDGTYALNLPEPIPIM